MVSRNALVQFLRRKCIEGLGQENYTHAMAVLKAMQEGDCKVQLGGISYDGNDDDQVCLTSRGMAVRGFGACRDSGVVVDISSLTSASLAEHVVANGARCRTSLVMRLLHPQHVSAARAKYAGSEKGSSVDHRFRLKLCGDVIYPNVKSCFVDLTPVHFSSRSLFL